MTTVHDLITKLMHHPAGAEVRRRHRKDLIMIGTKKLMELFDDPHRTSLRVHEANAEVAIEIGGVLIPVTGARWKSRPLAGRRQYTLIIQGDAVELAYLTQQKAQAATERAQEPQDEPQDGSEGTCLLPSGWSSTPRTEG